MTTRLRTELEDAIAEQGTVSGLWKWSHNLLELIWLALNG
jgi:hypothetical protein